MQETLKNIIKDWYGVDIEPKLTRPDPQFGDYATNVAMQLAGRLKKTPRDIATEIAEQAKATGQFSEVSIAGPGFINFRVAARYLADKLAAEFSIDYGNNSDGAGKTVLVEYPSPNVAKPYSVGHLRPGNQGWAARQLMRASGWNVVTDNHLGDYGAPFGAWVVGFRTFSSDEALERGGVYELGRVYIQIKAELKAEEAHGEDELAREVQDWLLKLEQGDEEAVAYSEKFTRISLEHIHAVMARLGIGTDHELGEKFYVERGKAAVQELLARGVATQNDDSSVIVSLDDHGLNVPLLVQKSNGAALYATTDLATILYREEHFKPDRVIYAVGAEQQFYFSQLFATAKKIGVDTELIHLWFGVIDQISEDGKREKMSSRKGVVLMEELLDKAEEKARAVASKGVDVSDDDVRKIALGAVKFSDFVADRRTNILFDWESIFALSGMSGPYVQYAAVRVNKILRANPEFSREITDYDYEAEKALLAKLLDYPQTVRNSARDLEPHKIANYLYKLARELNRYYETTRVNDAQTDEKAARLCVLEQASHVFTHGLDILGIEVPEQM